jgi:hypothetical protein
MWVSMDIRPSYILKQGNGVEHPNFFPSGQKVGCHLHHCSTQRSWTVSCTGRRSIVRNSPTKLHNACLCTHTHIYTGCLCLPLPVNPVTAAEQGLSKLWLTGQIRPFKYSICSHFPFRSFLNCTSITKYLVRCFQNTVTLMFLPHFYILMPCSESIQFFTTVMPATCITFCSISEFAPLYVWLSPWINTNYYPKQQGRDWICEYYLAEIPPSRANRVGLAIELISYSLKNKLRGLSPRANCTEQAKPLVDEVSANFWG